MKVRAGAASKVSESRIGSGSGLVVISAGWGMLGMVENRVDGMQDARGILWIKVSGYGAREHGRGKVGIVGR